MNWEAIGANGEIGGFIAILETLLFLTAQVRQNKAVALDAGSVMYLIERA